MFARLHRVNMSAGRHASGAALMIHHTAGFRLQRSGALTKQRSKAARKRCESVASSRRLFPLCVHQRSRTTAERTIRWISCRLSRLERAGGRSSWERRAEPAGRNEPSWDYSAHSRLCFQTSHVLIYSKRKKKNKKKGSLG